MKTDITDIPKLLSSKEMKRFGEFLNSPFFNIEARFVRFYEILRSKQNLSRDEICESFFGKGSSTADTRFRKLVSEFMKLFNRFLAECAFEKNELAQKNMLLDELREKNELERFLKACEDTTDYINMNCDKDEEYYLKKAELMAKRYAFEDSGIKKHKEDLCFEINDYIDRYFISLKVFLFQRMYSIEYVAKTDLSERRTFEKSIVDFILANKETLIENDPEIYLRYIAIKLDRQGYDEELYNEYLKVLYNSGNKFRINENGLLGTLINLLSKFINSGRNDLSEKVLEVAVIMYDKGIFAKYGISYIDLKIITECAIFMRTFDWALVFMNDVRKYIRDKNPDNIYNLIASKLYFFKGEYDKARELLSQITIVDYIFYCEAKLIECRIAYLQDQPEAVINACDTVLKYLSQNKSIGSHYAGAYKMFAELMRKLVIVLNKDFTKERIEFEINLMLKRLNNPETVVYAGQWLKKELEKLKAGL
ncbi:MAG: hypothetical protein IT281_05690 [Ignavibacteria bacterium]|nr:hypothetical protein [Ignavibacteria bacterium]